MTQPLVSVLVTCYNGMPYIQKAIDCMIHQSYTNLEIIVIDDHSTDGTCKFLTELSASAKDVFIFKNPMKGRGKALNFGLSKCKGKYVAINDADDFSMPLRIEKQVDFLENHPDYGLVGSMSELVNLENGMSMNMSVHRPVTNEDIRKYFIKGQPIQHVTVLFRKDLIISLGGYNEKIKFLFDRDLFLRIARATKMYNLEDILVQVGEHKNRFFKQQFTGVERNWLSTKYQVKAILELGYSPLRIIPVLASFMYSLFLNVKHPINLNEKK